MESVDKGCLSECKCHGGEEGDEKDPFKGWEEGVGGGRGLGFWKEGGGFVRCSRGG